MFEIFPILRIIDQDILINAETLSCKVTVILVKIVKKFEFSRKIFGKYINTNFHENPSSGSQKNLLRYRHSLLSQLSFFISFAQPVSVHCEYVYVAYTLVTMYRVTVSTNNAASETFYVNREWCEALTGYTPLGRRPGGDWANT